jgi:hypothetical protein
MQVEGNEDAKGSGEGHGAVPINRGKIADCRVQGTTNFMFRSCCEICNCKLPILTGLSFLK